MLPRPTTPTLLWHPVKTVSHRVLPCRVPPRPRGGLSTSGCSPRAALTSPPPRESGCSSWVWRRETWKPFFPCHRSSGRRRSQRSAGSRRWWWRSTPSRSTRGGSGREAGTGTARTCWTAASTLSGSRFKGSLLTRCSSFPCPSPFTLLSLSLSLLASLPVSLSLSPSISTLTAMSLSSSF